MSNATFADTLASIVERQAADVIDEPTAAAELLAAVNTWAGLSTTNNLLAARLSEFMMVVEGLIITATPPTADIGALGAYAFSVSNRAFYGPKLVAGWGDPTLVLDGTDATIEIDSVTTLETGEAATVENVGDPTAARLRFGLPKGGTGDQGPAGSVTINSVTTGAAGTSAAVVNTGTAQAAVLDITIPRGDQGIQGDAATITINSITMLAADQPPSVTNTGDQYDAVLDIELPRGETGRVANSFRGAWAPATQYRSGDIVEHEGSSYICNEGNTDIVGAVPSGASPTWTLLVSKGADAGAGGEVLLTADATLDDETAPPGVPIFIDAVGATNDRITLTIPDDRPLGWRRAFYCRGGSAAFNFGNNTLTIGGELQDLVTDTAIIEAGERATLRAFALASIEGI